MWRVGVQGEQVCFIFDESNVLSPAFLERYRHLASCRTRPVRLVFLCILGIIFGFPFVLLVLVSLRHYLYVLVFFFWVDSAVGQVNVQPPNL